MNREDAPRDARLVALAWRAGYKSEPMPDVPEGDAVLLELVKRAWESGQAEYRHAMARAEA